MLAAGHQVRESKCSTLKLHLLKPHRSQSILNYYDRHRSGTQCLPVSWRATYEHRYQRDRSSYFVLSTDNFSWLVIVSLFAYVSHVQLYCSCPACLSARSESLHEITGALYTLVATNMAMSVTSLILGLKSQPEISFHE